MKQLVGGITTNIIPNYIPETYEVKQGNVIVGYVERYKGAFRGITLCEKKLKLTLRLYASAEKVVKASRTILK